MHILLYYKSQFHFGSIQTFVFEKPICPGCMSQFHFGSIQTTRGGSHFQIILPRMSQFHFGSIQTEIILFQKTKIKIKSQFHFGSIQTKRKNLETSMI